MKNLKYSLLKKVNAGMSFRIFATFMITFIAFTTSAFAQDVLILKSGKELKVSIVEEGTDIIKYREFDNLSGPLYSVTRANVAGIKYENGSKVNQDSRVVESDKTLAATQSNNSGLLTAKM
jgi:hypothetical protein